MSTQSAPSNDLAHSNENNFHPKVPQIMSLSMLSPRVISLFFFSFKCLPQCIVYIFPSYTFHIQKPPSSVQHQSQGTILEVRYIGLYL